MELLALQRLDDRIATLRAEIATIDAELRSHAALDRATAAVERARAAEDVEAAAYRQAEAAAITRRARVKHLEGQLYGGRVQGARELTTLQRELDDLYARAGAQEGEELAMLERSEAATAARHDAEQDVLAIEERRREEQGPLEGRRVDAATDLADAQAERALEASRCGAAELALYTRLAARLRPAVARLAGDACGACRFPLGMREVRAVRHESEIPQCPNCDRVLAP